MVVLKTSKELSDMKLSCKISAQALRLAGQLIKPGVSTAYVDKMLHAFLLTESFRKGTSSASTSAQPLEATPATTRQPLPQARLPRRRSG